MNKAHLFFTQYTNSFSVYIENLEELSVEQIKEIEGFVSARRGFFDFGTYSFAIQKKLSFQEFAVLIKNSHIDAVCHEKLVQASVSKSRIEFGKYKGLYYSDVPDSYLIWLKSNYKGRDRELLDVELINRNL